MGGCSGVGVVIGTVSSGGCGKGTVVMGGCLGGCGQSLPKPSCL